MRRKRFGWNGICAASLLAATQSPCLADQLVSYWIAGEGTRSCGAYLAASQDKKPNSSLVVHDLSGQAYYSENYSFDSWILGFVAGLNYDTAGNGLRRLEIRVDNEGILTWIRDYCKNHPADQIGRAAAAFAKGQYEQQ